MNIHIITVGKVREKYIKLGTQEFEKRLSSYCKLTFSELMDEQAPEQLNEKELLSVKKKEGERILNKVKQDHYVIALDIKGVSWSSEQFADKLRKLSFQGKNQVTFIIGGQMG